MNFESLPSHLKPLHSALDRVLDDGALTTTQQRKEAFMKTFPNLNMNSVKQYRSIIEERQRDRAVEIARLESERDNDISVIDKEIARIDDMLAWIKLPFKLERNDNSRIHKLRDALIANRIVWIKKEDQGSPLELLPAVDNAQVFVVRHDWAGVLGENVDAEFVLPYPHCAFEFRSAGKTIIACIGQIDGDMALCAFVESLNDHWAFVGELGQEIVHTKVVRDHIRAICIALDAEIATHEVQRAPHALNKKRLAAGKSPLVEFHVVDLAKRYRAIGASHASTDRKVRLHFRRGHWRHFESSKTWIRWMLVGDPALGFIAKHYEL